MNGSVEHGLTEQEAEVLTALAVDVSVETVKTHITKLGGRGRTQAVGWAYRSGFSRR
ncbi:hypothetical protein [Herbidospora daliensis]|uniref:hypothetical protein n=1 Tax=Herbidospora daliensis TaxID=295585 RepID=UPI000B1F7C24|nr:hypothetical protein [Herbidospora daliensis]